MGILTFAGRVCHPEFLCLKRSLTLDTKKRDSFFLRFQIQNAIIQECTNALKLHKNKLREENYGGGHFAIGCYFHSRNIFNPECSPRGGYIFVLGIRGITGNYCFSVNALRDARRRDYCIAPEEKGFCKENRQGFSCVAGAYLF